MGGRYGEKGADTPAKQDITGRNIENRAFENYNSTRGRKRYKEVEMERAGEMRDQSAAMASNKSFSSAERSERS